MRNSAISERSVRRPGRPVEFDRATALHAAMLHFWRYGYEGSSLSDLTKAMDISKPTLYAAFGDKMSLFREAVTAYASLRAKEYASALALPTAREVADAWLRLTGGVTPTEGSPSGCLLVLGAISGNGDTAVLREELASLRRQGTLDLRKRFRRAQRQGDLPASVDPDVLAEYLASLANGMALQSASGVSPKELNRVVDLVMANWPKTQP
jgi:AcrR family transcriptional regulator